MALKSPTRLSAKGAQFCSVMAWEAPGRPGATRFNTFGTGTAFCLGIYRGLYGSSLPADPNALRITDHARDGLHLLKEEGADRAAILGWSMGVQVGLEMFRAAPERVASLAMLNGVAGRPWDYVFNLNLSWATVASVPPRSALDASDNRDRNRPGDTNSRPRRVGEADRAGGEDAR